MNLQENSLYKTPAQKQVFSTDTTVAATAFYLNFLGFLSLLRSKDTAALTAYSKSMGKLQAMTMEDDNSDWALTVRAAVTAGAITNPVAIKLTKFLALIKTGKVKSQDIDDNKIRDLIRECRPNVHKPSPKVFRLVMSFLDGKLDLLGVGQKIYRLSKIDDFSVLLGEYSDIVTRGGYVGSLIKAAAKPSPGAPTAAAGGNAPVTSAPRGALPGLVEGGTDDGEYLRAIIHLFKLKGGIHAYLDRFGFKASFDTARFNRAIHSPGFTIGHGYHVPWEQHPFIQWIRKRDADLAAKTVKFLYTFDEHRANGTTPVAPAPQASPAAAPTPAAAVKTDITPMPVLVKRFEERITPSFFKGLIKSTNNQAVELEIAKVIELDTGDSISAVMQRCHPHLIKVLGNVTPFGMDGLYIQAQSAQTLLGFWGEAMGRFLLRYDLEKYGQALVAKWILECMKSDEGMAQFKNFIKYFPNRSALDFAYFYGKQVDPTYFNMSSFQAHLETVVSIQRIAMYAMGTVRPVTPFTIDLLLACYPKTPSKIADLAKRAPLTPVDYEAFLTAANVNFQRVSDVIYIQKASMDALSDDVSGLVAIMNLVGTPTGFGVSLKDDIANMQIMHVIDNIHVKVRTRYYWSFNDEETAVLSSILKDIYTDKIDEDTYNSNPAFFSVCLILENESDKITGMTPAEIEATKIKIFDSLMRKKSSSVFKDWTNRVSLEQYVQSETNKIFSVWLAWAEDNSSNLSEEKNKHILPALLSMLVYAKNYSLHLRPISPHIEEFILESEEVKSLLSNSPEKIFDNCGGREYKLVTNNLKNVYPALLKIVKPSSVASAMLLNSNSRTAVPPAVAKLHIEEWKKANPSYSPISTSERENFAKSVWMMQDLESKEALEFMELQSSNLFQMIDAMFPYSNDNVKESYMELSPKLYSAIINRIHGKIEGATDAAVLGVLPKAMQFIDNARIGPVIDKILGNDALVRDYLIRKPSGYENNLSLMISKLDGRFKDLDPQDQARISKKLTEISKLLNVKDTPWKATRDEMNEGISNIVLALHETQPALADKLYGEMGRTTRTYLVKSQTDIDYLAAVSKDLYSHEIKPAFYLDHSRIKQILKYNRLPISAQISTRMFSTIADIKNTVVPQPKIGDLKVTKVFDGDTEALEKETVRLATFRNGKHGTIGMRVLKVFDVEFPGEKEAIAEFRKKYPKDGTVTPAFHGTGSVAASMILRNGFQIIPENDASTVGRMLGNGIYFSNVIDKAQQYLGDQGSTITRKVGSTGYVFEMEAEIGERNSHYKAAGLGGDSIRSPEWAVFQPETQLRIYRAYFVELRPMKEIVELGKKHNVVLKESNDKSTFTDFLYEDEGTKTYQSTFWFMQPGYMTKGEDWIETDGHPIVNKNMIVEESWNGGTIVTIKHGPEFEEVTATLPSIMGWNDSDFREKYLERLG